MLLTGSVTPWARIPLSSVRALLPLPLICACTAPPSLSSVRACSVPSWQNLLRLGGPSEDVARSSSGSGADRDCLPPTPGQRTARSWSAPVDGEGGAEGEGEAAGPSGAEAAGIGVEEAAEEPTA